MVDHPTPKSLQEALAASVRRADSLQARLDATHGMIDAISEAIYIQDADGRFLDVNEGAARMYGYPRDFFTGKTPEILSAPGRNEPEAVARAFNKTLHGEPQQFEFWGRRRDGGIFPKEVRLYPGTYLGQTVVIAIAQDISGRKRAETERRILTAAMDFAIDPVFGMDASGRFVFVNQAACASMGYPREEFLRLSVWDVDPQILPGQWPDRWDKVRAKGANRAETLHRRKDGTVFPVEISSSFLAVEGREVIFTNVRDISSRKVAEEALRASEEKFSSAFQATPDAINIHRIDGTYLDINPAFTLMSGWTREEVLGRTTLDFELWVNPSDRIRMQQLIQADGHFAGLETPFRMKDGAIRTGLVSGTLIQVDGEPCLLTITRDITERKAAEQALTEERGLFVGGPVMVFKWRTGPGWLVEYASPNTESILGYPVSDLVEGKISFENLIHPDDLERVLDEIADAMAKGLLHFEQQYRLRTASGEYRWFYDFSTAAAQSPNPSHFLGYLLDITDRRQAEDALRQSLKLESLGILAGGIAHDFNNLLTVVLGNLNLAQMHLPENAPAQPYLANMEATVLRATELTRQMLAYSGRGHFLVKPQDLNEAVREVTHLLEVSIPKKIWLRFDLEPGLPAIQADAAQIQQVVMNLVTNASDAIGEMEGIIHLSTSAAILDERELRSTYRGESLAPGRYVLLEVADTGTGMSQEVMTRIFDPFFTTKATGRGLGLSAMLGILRGHGAGLRIASEVGRGSSFRICFPASDERPARPAAAPETTSFHPLRGRILLVDDEDLILQTIGSALKTLGLDVLTARDGLEALEQFQKARPRPDLVLMDLTMPRMDGREAFLAMHGLDPSIPVVLSSGFTERDSTNALSGLEPAGFLQKPYQIRELRRMLQRVLGG